MILVSVLGAIGIIYIMIVQMSADAMFAAEYYQRIEFREKAYYMSRSAYTGVMNLFTLDDPTVDSFRDDWAQALPPYHLEDEQVYISVKVEDLERYFNPNYIIEDDDIEEKHYNQFRRLLEVLLIEPDIANPIADWIDADHQRRNPMGADGLDYREIPVKGAPLDSVAEIKLIKGITPEIFQGQEIEGKKYKGLRDVLTVYSNGYVNVNTADQEVLMSLDDQVTDSMAGEIIRRRDEEPFSSMDDLLKLPGMNHDLLFRMKQVADVKSEYFKITITVENYLKETSDLNVIVKRSGQTGKVILWQAD
ncbi:MAG: type II secretion system minor pseudopilin GspK [Vulcanimicrobiota bacterium]